MTENTLTPIEAINEFYRLKDKYQLDYYDKYVKSIVRTDMSKKEKRIKFSRLPKHECVNCKRNVGTLFTVKYITEESIKYFIAKCGDIQDPCPLDIQISYSNRELMDDDIKHGLDRIENIKLDIIKEKNNAMFFNKNVVNIFNKLTEELKIETENTGFTIETNILRNNNPEKAILLKQTINDFGKEFILPFKQMIKQFDETNNQSIINQAVTFYVNEMIPKLKQIQLLKYDVSIVELIENNEVKLIQLPNSLERNEYYYKTEDKVIKFVKGLKKEKKKTKKEIIVSKKKTQKKPISEIVLLDDEDFNITEKDEIIQTIEPKFADTVNIKPIFNISGNVTWNNEQYDKLWKTVPNKLKELLIQDRNWLEDYINNCIKLKKQGKPCELFLPKQTKFPPDLGSDGKYEFGSEIVNKLFNRLSKQHQDILLTVYSVKDGIKNYDSLKYTLASMLAKEINFERGYF